jgi:hypothetical protein
VTTPQLKLWTLQAIAKHLGIPAGSAHHLGKQMTAAYKPVFSSPSGRGVQKYYSDEDAQAFMAKWRAEHLPKPTEVKPVAVSTGAEAQIKILANHIKELDYRLEEQQQQTHQLMTVQNRALLETLNKHNALLMQIAKELGVEPTVMT